MNYKTLLSKGLLLGLFFSFSSFVSAQNTPKGVSSETAAAEVKTKAHYNWGLTEHIKHMDVEEVDRLEYKSKKLNEEYDKKDKCVYSTLGGTEKQRLKEVAEKIEGKRKKDWSTIKTLGAEEISRLEMKAEKIEEAVAKREAAWWKKHDAKMKTKKVTKVSYKKSKRK